MGDSNGTISVPRRRTTTPDDAPADSGNGEIGIKVAHLDEALLGKRLALHTSVRIHQGVCARSRTGAAASDQCCEHATMSSPCT